MTSPTPKKQLIAAIVATLVVAIIIIYALLRQDDRGELPSTEDEVEQGQTFALEAWPTDEAAEALTLVLDETKGPIWQRGDEQVVLTPTSEALGFEDWSLETLETQTRMTGIGVMGDARARAVWTFADGNPQAHLLLEFEGLSSQTLEKTIALGAKGASGEGQQPERLVLWKPAGGLSCKTSEQPTRFDLRIENVATFGDSPAVSVWPYAQGASARLVPIFDLPERHSDAEIARSAAKEASAWVSRARTLIYGHSNPDDPRYGNGGLLGHGLGGTLAVPPKWVEHPEVVELAKELQGTRVELAPRGDAAAFPVSSTRFSSQPSCQDLVEWGKSGVPAVLIAGEKSDEWSVAQAPLPSTAAPMRFDGQLSSLLARGLDTRKLDDLVRRQGQLVFSTPFVASRNPLVGAFQEALLEPERNGQWTVAAELSEALANLELWREEAPLSVTSVAGAASLEAQSKRVLLWRTQDGGLRVHNPASEPIAGFTLLVDGVVEAELDGQALPSRQITRAKEREATLLWWDLAPGTHTLALTDGQKRLAAPEPVRWQVEQR